MLEKFLEKKYIVAICLLVIIAAAFAVRFWNFHDWLYFKMDQARDAFTVSNAVLGGPGNLPLLGARAGATEVTYGFLNLGPIFYYFQYISGVIFHSIDPAVFAYPDLFFGLAVLPLLYVFARIYFKRYISLGIVILYAFSFLIIEYSRFAWNPNSLPFFTILSFFSLLKFFHPQKEEHRKWWIILWAIGLAVGSQLHFVGFFSLVGVSALMFFWHYRLWNLSRLKNIFQKQVVGKITAYAGLAILAFLVFYTPVIISDSMKNWENSKNFVEALSSKPSDNTLAEKFLKNVSQETRYYTLLTTSYIYRPDKVKLKESLPIFFTVLIFLGGIYLAIKKVIGLKDERKRNFLMIVLLWFLVYFILCIPLAYSIRPRFFIFTFAVPFLFAGLIAEYLEESKHEYKSLAAGILGACILFGNIWGTSLWFREQALSQKEHLKIDRTLILKNKDGVTLGQMERAAEFILARLEEGDRLYFYVKPEHVRPMKYIFFQKNPGLSVEQLKINSDPRAKFFAIVPSDYESQDVSKKVERDFTLLSKEKFGQIAVWEIDFSDRLISPDFLLEDPAVLGSENNRRIFWRDVFEGDGKDEGVFSDYNSEEIEGEDVGETE